MDIRTFRAATLQEALEQVRETLGPDAAVLHTRQVKRSRMGLFSSRLIEVEASVEMPVASRLNEALSEILAAGVDPAEAKTILSTVAQQLAPEQLNDASLLHGRICQLVSKNLRVAEPIAIHRSQQAVVALVGPTGVGKTTTLAKLATRFQLDHSCHVGLMTLDTFRPGAVDQLLQYAESLNAALEVVSSANQFLPALHRLKDCNVVLIDTAGRSPHDTEQIHVLKGLLGAAEPTSVQLVVSATSSLRYLQATLEQFSPLSPTGLVITKLDEAVGFGAWLSTLQHCDLPVSYVTHGQHVPRDFSAANPRRLASLLLGHAHQPAA